MKGDGALKYIGVLCKNRPGVTGEREGEGRPETRMWAGRKGPMIALGVLGDLGFQG